MTWALNVDKTPGTMSAVESLLFTRDDLRYIIVDCEGASPEAFEELTAFTVPGRSALVLTPRGSILNVARNSTDGDWTVRYRGCEHELSRDIKLWRLE